MTAGPGSVTHHDLSAYVAEQARADRMRAADRCPHCRHDFHGLACIGLVSGVHMASGCQCPSSWEAMA